MKNSLNISIIIIGYNTCRDLKKLLYSINNLSASSEILEIIYVDDGSQDSSLKMFRDFNLKFLKKSKKNRTNQGRSFSTQEGSKLASGDWYLFIRSNELVSKPLIEEFKKAIKTGRGYAYMGAVNYQSRDKCFEKYLNNKKRGVNPFPCGKKIHYKFLLFNNSIIYKRVFNLVSLNPKLKHYGGEELDFSFKMNRLFPNMICAWPDALVFRKNYPDFLSHCQRLEEFGFLNFPLLSKNLQLDVVYYNFLLKKYLFFRVLLFCLYPLLNFLAKKTKPGYLAIRFYFLISILKGYYRVS